MTRAKRLPMELAEVLTAGDNSFLQDKTDMNTRFCVMLMRDVFQNGLTKTQKCYIMLYYVHGLTMEEIAKRCGVNRSTVSRVIKAARRKINDRVLRLYNKTV